MGTAGRTTARSVCRLGPVSVLAAAVLATGCAIVPVLPSSPVRGEPAAPCATAAVRSCALPYPSDEFTVADPSSATGLAVEMPADLLSASLLSRMGPGATPADAFAGADGFASLSPVIFELDRAVARSSLAADGGDVLVVFDAATGERMPIRAEVPVEAARHGAPDTIVMAWPSVRWEPGRTYIARLSDGLRTRSGGTPGRAPGLDRATELRDELARLEGDRWAETLSATRFTVRSAENATTELDAMADIVRSEPHPIRNLRVDPPWLVGDVASAVVNGEVLVSDFRDENGIARVSNGSRPVWIPFVMVVPATPAGPEGAPIAIYGHGLTVFKESMLIVAATNAQMGVATVGIDVPNHGARQAGEGGYLFDNTTAETFGRLASMPLQGVVDHLSLLMAVQQHFGELDLTVPAHFFRPATSAPELDPTRVLYQGTSMGGVLGAAFVALAPELEGAFLHVAGTGITDIIFHSLLWPLFMGIVPNGASTGDAYALIGAATMLLDHADNVNVLDRILGAGTPMFLVYGAGDGVVGNVASDRLITLADLPLVGRELVPVSTPHRRTGSDRVPADGRGAVQLWPADPIELQSLNGHLVFALSTSDALLREWLGGRLAASLGDD